MNYPPRIYRRFEDMAEVNPLSNEILFVGTAYNRKGKITDDPECYDMPGLINPDGSLYTNEQEIMKNSCLDENYKYILPYIKNLLKKEIMFSTVDPTYETNKTKFENDPKNYIGHYSMLFNELKENVTDFDHLKKYAIICVMSCYKDFFDKTNINKINKLLDNKGYLIIYDTVPYEFTLYFNQKFIQIV